MDERTFLDANDIKVTNTRFVVRGQTYAMASVNSVKVLKSDVTPPTTVPGLMVGVGAVWLLVHLLSSPKDIVGHLWPLALLVAGILWIWNTKNKYQFKLILTTSSGETPVLVSERSDDILPVERALTDAIVYRG